MKWLRLVLCELRSIWLFAVVTCVLYSVIQFLNPSLGVWCVLSYLFPFAGVLLKVRQCRKDMQHQNMLVFYGLTSNRMGLLLARIVAGVLVAWCFYGVQLLLMHGTAMFTRDTLTATELDFVRENYHFVPLAVDREGMFSLELSIVLRMLLTITLFTLLVEVTFVVRDLCAFAYGMVFILFMAFRCLFLRLPEGATLYHFLVNRLPAIWDMIFYVLCFVGCFFFLRRFTKGVEGGQESYVDTAGHEVA